MNKYTKELIELMSQNPDLEVKFFIDGELNEEYNSWFVGDITHSKVSEYIDYQDRAYDDIGDVKELIAQEVVCEDREMSDENLDILVEEEFSKLEVKKVIIVYISIER